MNRGIGNLHALAALQGARPIALRRVVLLYTRDGPCLASHFILGPTGRHACAGDVEMSAGEQSRYVTLIRRTVRRSARLV